MRGRPLVSRRRTFHLPACGIHIVMTLRWAFDAVGPVEAGIEPLRRVRGGHLRRQHVAGLVIECAGVGFGGKVAALPTPVRTAAGQAVEDLASIRLLESGEW